MYAKGNYSYILEKGSSKTNQLYSWGMGENYVLGSREDDNQYKPYTVHPRMFDEFPVLMLGAGTQHVVVLTSDSQERQDFPQFAQEVLDFKLPEPPKPAKKEKVEPAVEEEKKAPVVEAPLEVKPVEAKPAEASKKRKRSEMEASQLATEPKQEVKQEKTKRRKVEAPSSQKAKAAAPKKPAKK